MSVKQILFFFSLFFLIFSYLLYQQVSSIKPHCDIDSSAYLQNAALFCQTGSFAERKKLPYYTLGYPFVMGVLYKIFGKHQSVIIFFQILLALMSGFLIFIIARRLFNQRVALLSFIFFSCNLGFLVFAQFLLTEILLVFFLLLFVERFTAYVSVCTPFDKAQDRHSTRCLRQLAQSGRRGAFQPFALSEEPCSESNGYERLIMSGLFLGCSVLVKPAALYYPFLLVPLIIMITQGSWWQKNKSALFFLGAFFIPIFGYMTHNFIVFKSFKLSSLDQVNLLIWFLPNVLAEKYGTDNRVERELLQRKSLDQVRLLFLHEFKKTPFLFLRVWLKNVGKTFLGLFASNLKVLVGSYTRGDDSSFFKTKGPWLERIHQYVTGGTPKLWVKIVAWLEVLWSLLRYFFVIYAFLALIQKRKYFLLYFFFSYIFYFSFITGHDGCARFRMMFEWALIILAAFGVWMAISERIEDGIKPLT